MTPLRVGGSLGGIQVLRLAFGIESSSAECYRFSLAVEHRENQPAAKTIVRAAFIFPDHQPAFLQLLLGSAFLSQMRGAFESFWAKPFHRSDFAARSFPFHRPLFEAIASHDADAARRHTLAILAIVEEDIIRMSHD